MDGLIAVDEGGDDFGDHGTAFRTADNEKCELVGIKIELATNGGFVIRSFELGTSEPAGFDNAVFGNIKTLEIFAGSAVENEVESFWGGGKINKGARVRDDVNEETRILKIMFFEKMIEHEPSGDDNVRFLEAEVV